MVAGDVLDLPIELPQLTGAHTGERLAEVINLTLTSYGITPLKLGYFVLDNAHNNDTAIAALSRLNSFIPSHRRLRCGPHTLNLIGQMMIFGKDKDAYNNAAEELKDEEKFLQDWRKDGPLGVLIAIISYIKTPQQYDLFSGFQKLANSDIPTDQRRVLEPVKPVVTRWNSFYGAFERAAHLHVAYDSYASYHIKSIAQADAMALGRGNKLPDAPAWMRSSGLGAADWAVITEYIDLLRPLKYATERLEGRGKSGRFGAIYEIIPVFEYLLIELETRCTQYEHVDFNAHAEAPEDHLAINLKAAWRKANDYYTKLDDSPAYYAATCLHPYYKYYCEHSWHDKPGWLEGNNRAFRQLWATYKTITAPAARRSAASSSIDDAIDAMANRDEGSELLADEYDCWRKYEPKWTRKQFEQDGNVIYYWIGLQLSYPQLSKLAIDILTIPASSCDCERLFS